MSSSTTSSSNSNQPLPWPTLRLRNPFVLRFTQIITGIGVGCGVGVGVGVPLPMGALGGQIPTGEISMYINKGRRFVQPVLKKAGIKRLDAGIGCGVGVGHGFALVGLGLKPGVAEEIMQFMQDGFKALMSRVQPQTGSLPLVESNVGPLANLSSSTPAATPLAQVPAASQSFSLNNADLGGMLTGYASKAGLQVPPGLAVAPQLQQQSGRNDEIERLKLEKDVLHTLLRQQKQIDDLREELRALQQDNRSSSSEYQKDVQCFDCRRKNRK